MLLPLEERFRSVVEALREPLAEDETNLAIAKLGRMSVSLMGGSKSLVFWTGQSSVEVRRYSHNGATRFLQLEEPQTLPTSSPLVLRRVYSSADSPMSGDYNADSYFGDKLFIMRAAMMVGRLGSDLASDVEIVSQQQAEELSAQTAAAVF